MSLSIHRPSRLAASALISALFAVACSANNEKGSNPPTFGADAASDVEETTPTDDTGLEDTGSFNLDTGTQDVVASETGECASAEAAAIKKPVDIIMVIDQSGSMGEEIAQVKDNINKLSSFLAGTGLDYRLVMIAGKSGALPVCVPPPLAGASCESKSPRFRSVDQHVESWDGLKLVLQTYDNTTDTSKKWADALRYDAVKVFIPVSDDDARDSFLPEPRATSFDEALLSRGKGTFGTKGSRKYVFYPIVGVTSPTNDAKCATAVNNGQVYLDLVKLTKGKAFSVCETSYKPVFEAIAKAIASSVACEITIPPPPDGATFDPDKVNVVYKDSGGGVNTIAKDETAGCFEGSNGWQYDETKSKILLCGDACAQAKSDPGAIINVAFGCKTVVK